MKKRTWIPVLIIVVGVCLALGGFALGGMKSIWFDRGGFQLANNDRGALVTVNEKYTGCTAIEVNVDFLDRVIFKEGDDFTVSGQNYERYGGLKVTKDGDKLRVDARREGRWINIGIDEWRGWGNTDTWVEITYPKGTDFEDLRANISAGRLSISDVECGTLNVNNDFGNVELSGISAGRIAVDLSAGDAKLTSVGADSLRISNDFGKVNLQGVGANSLTVRMSAGDVSGENIVTDQLDVTSDFGAVRLHRLTLNNRGDINQSSGEVDLSLEMSEDDLSYELSTSAGSVSVDGSKFGSSVVNRSTGTNASLRIDSDFGAIKIKFLQ